MKRTMSILLALVVVLGLGAMLVACRSNSGDTWPPAEEPTTTTTEFYENQQDPEPDALPQYIVPRAPAVAGGPEDPPVSAQRAVELAHEHLSAIGVQQARFDYVYMDRENGVWVWSVEFDGPGRSYEFYVDVNTGRFLKAPQTSGASNTPATTPPTTTTGQTNNRSATTQVSDNRNQRPQNPAISRQRAIEIAYADLARRGIAASFHAASGMDWERGQWVWELEFRPAQGRGMIEYYINVNTGAIVKFEFDR